jgi:excisionase family DNA binding protein
MPEQQQDRLLTPGEVARLFRVDPKTVTRWAQSGRINRIRTPGGHSRFSESEVRRLLEENGAAAGTDGENGTDALIAVEALIANVVRPPAAR